MKAMCLFVKRSKCVVIEIFKDFEDSISHINLSPSGNTMLIGLDNGKAELWNCGRRHFNAETNYKKDTSLVLYMKLYQLLYMKRAEANEISYSLAKKNTDLMAQKAILAAENSEDLLSSANTDTTRCCCTPTKRHAQICYMWSCPLAFPFLLFPAFFILPFVPCCMLCLPVSENESKNEIDFSLKNDHSDII